MANSQQKTYCKPAGRSDLLGLLCGLVDRGCGRTSDTFASPLVMGKLADLEGRETIKSTRKRKTNLAPRQDGQSDVLIYLRKMTRGKERVVHG